MKVAGNQLLLVTFIHRCSGLQTSIGILDSRDEMRVLALHTLLTKVASPSNSDYWCLRGGGALVKWNGVDYRVLY